MRPTTTKQTKQRGLLLLECLVAIVVLATGLLGGVSLAALLARQVDEARYRVEAQQLAHALLARMIDDAPAGLATRYAPGSGIDAYREFVARAARLPGADTAGNAPEVIVGAGPSVQARTVSVTLRWQMPGDTRVHRYAATTVVGGP